MCQKCYKDRRAEVSIIGKKYKVFMSQGGVEILQHKRALTACSAGKLIARLRESNEYDNLIRVEVIKVTKQVILIHPYGKAQKAHADRAHKKLQAEMDKLTNKMARLLSELSRLPAKR